MDVFLASHPLFVAPIGPFSNSIPAILEYPGPPASQIPHGLLDSVFMDPFECSKPQKKAVLFGDFAVFVEIDPA